MSVPDVLAGAVSSARRDRSAPPPRHPLFVAPAASQNPSASLPFIQFPRHFPRASSAMSNDQELFDTPDAFEALGQENGEPFWWQSDLQTLLGYRGNRSFGKAVGRAIQAMNALAVPVTDNVRHTERVLDDGTVRTDCQLSRFACYLVAMNADPRKNEVALAQAYFATLATAVADYEIEVEGVERVLIRDEITGREKELSGTAKLAGVVNYAFFQSAGYLGLYNMPIRRLKSLKGVPERRTVLDFMGKEELAANLFRITQTDAQVRRGGTYGQTALENTARRVGGQVRKAIKDIGGTMPEDLPPAGDIRQVKKGLKQTQRALKKVDKNRK